MQKQPFPLLNTFLMVSISLIITILLIGQAFHFSWAGGQGYLPQKSVFILGIEGEVIAQKNGKDRRVSAGEKISRGEMIKTSSDSRILLRTSDNIDIALDQNAVMRLDNLQKERLSVFLSGGRLMIYRNEALSPIEIKTKLFSHTWETGNVTLINYDFLQRIRVIPFGGKVKNAFDENAYALENTEPIDLLLNEEALIAWKQGKRDIVLDPSQAIEVKPTAFKPETDEPHFYKWTEDIRNEFPL